MDKLKVYPIRLFLFLVFNFIEEVNVYESNCYQCVINLNLGKHGGYEETILFNVSFNKADPVDNHRAVSI